MRTIIRWWSKLAAVTIAGSLLLPLLLLAEVRAESETVSIPANRGQDTAYSRTIPLYFDDLVLRGTRARHDAFFEIGKGQQAAGGSYLDLVFSHSPSLLAGLSSLSVLIDDVPVDGIALDSRETESKSWRVDLSGLHLGPGYHKVSLVAQMKLSDRLCEDPDSELLWLKLQKTSKAVLTLGKVYDQADLSWYPSPFLERGADNPLDAVIVVPDRIEQAVFAAAARFSQFFAAQTPGGRLQIPIYKESDLPENLLESRNAIWIGGADRWGERGKKALEAAAKASGSALQDLNVIAEAQSPWNPSRTHLIVAGNDERLQTAAAILTTEALYRQLQGNVLKIPEQVAAPGNEAAAKAGDIHSVTLKQLGIDHLKVENVLQGSAQFQYQLPADLELGDDALLHLKYSHSDSIVYQKSVMTVKVNGIPVGSAGLTERTSGGGTLDVPIDPSIAGASRQLNVEIGFQFANPAADRLADRDDGCRDVYLGDWAVADGDSAISFTPKERKDAYLQSLPYPFVKEERWTDTAFLAPQMGTKELQLAMTLIGKIGVQIPDVSGVRMEQLSSGWEERLKNKNIVFIGKAADLPAALNGFEGSYVRFADGTAVSQSPLVPLLEPLQRNFAVAQLTVSPLAADKHLLLLAAATPERLDAIGAAMTDAEASAKLTSRFAAIDGKGEVFAFPATEDKIEPQAPSRTIRDERMTSFSLDGLAFAVVLIIGVAAVAFAVYWSYRRSKE